jgi:1,2-diacylglycerol 3-beta-galactosyltransferase
MRTKYNHSRSIKVRGLRIHYLESRSEITETIVMLHGFRSSHEGLMKLADQFPNSHLIIPDFPGYGESDELQTGNNTVTAYANVIAGLIRKLKLTNVTLLGHSFGALVGLACAAEHPTFVQRLIMVSPVPRPNIVTRAGGIYYRIGRALPAPLDREWLTNSAIQKQMRGYIVRTDDPVIYAEVMSEGERELKNLHANINLENYFSLSSIDPAKWLTQLKTLPVLVVTGDADPLTPLEDVIIGYQLPGITLKVIEGMGHFSPAEIPVDIANVIRQWMKTSGNIKDVKDLPQATPLKRILLIMSTAGGGHKSAAQSIAEALEAKYGSAVKIETVDFLKDYAPQPLDRMPEAYQLMIRSPAAWKSLYEITDGVRRSKMINQSIALATRRQSDRLLEEHPSDVIISTYHFANTSIIESMHRHENITPFVTVVTDLVTAPPVWFDMRTTLCIVPTPEVKELALLSGLEPESVTVIGMPVAARFVPAKRPKSELKSKLGWPADKPAIIAMAGGEGIGSLDNIAEVLTTLDATIVVICGKNTHLYKKLSKPTKPDNLIVYGFVDNMDQFMQAADLIVTKAGPGTIMEALNSNLPLIIYSKLSGQEDGNVSFVTENGAGIWQPKISEMDSTVGALIAKPEVLDGMAKAAASIAQTGASSKIARAIIKLIDVQT